MTCDVCLEEMHPELAWFICGCGLSFAVQQVDERLDVWCPAGHVYEAADQDG